MKIETKKKKKKHNLQPSLQLSPKSLFVGLFNTQMVKSTKINPKSCSPPNLVLRYLGKSGQNISDSEVKQIWEIPIAVANLTVWSESESSWRIFTVFSQQGLPVRSSLWKSTESKSIQWKSIETDWTKSDRFRLFLFFEEKELPLKSIGDSMLCKFGRSCDSLVWYGMVWYCMVWYGWATY